MDNGDGSSSTDSGGLLPLFARSLQVGRSRLDPCNFLQLQRMITERVLEPCAG
jgi:hypothetical protein